MLRKAKTLLVVFFMISSLMLVEAYEVRAQEMSPSNCTYKHLLLIYSSTNVTYLDGDEEKTFIGNMSADLEETVINDFKNLPNLITDGSQGVVSSTYQIIEISHPVTKITSYPEGYYWLSPTDIAEDLELYAAVGIYDSVHVVWYSGPIKVNWGMGGIFINKGTTTFSSIIAGQVSWYDSTHQVFLHEWLHGVCAFYANLGYPMPALTADGGPSHGYNWTSTEGLMQYYRDLMRGLVWEPTLSEYTGITKQAWTQATPNSYLSPSPSPTSRASPTPTIPEFSSIIVITILLTAIATIAAVIKNNLWLAKLDSRNLNYV